MNIRIIASYIFILGFFGFLGFSYMNYSKSNSLKAIEKKFIKHSDIETTLRKTFEEHPEIVIDAIKKYQEKKEQALQQLSAKKINSMISEVENSPNDPNVGSNTPKVTIVEFFDYNCGFCKKLASIKTKIIEENSNIKYVFKELPILGEASMLSAKAALTVNKIAPTKYLAFHVALLNDNRPKSIVTLEEIAGKVGVDVEKFKTHLEDPDLNKIISENHKLAQEIGIQGTPAYIIDGQLIPGMLGYKEMNKRIKDAISAKDKK